MPLDRSMAEQRLGFPLILGAHDHQVCSRQHAQAPTRARAIAGLFVRFPLPPCHSPFRWICLLRHFYEPIVR
jgi:hypothetical protein